MLFVPHAAGSYTIFCSIFYVLIFILLFPHTRQHNLCVRKEEQQQQRRQQHVVTERDSRIHGGVLSSLIFIVQPGKKDNYYDFTRITLTCETLGFLSLSLLLLLTMFYTWFQQRLF